MHASGGGNSTVIDLLGKSAHDCLCMCIRYIMNIATAVIIAL